MCCMLKLLWCCEKDKTPIRTVSVSDILEARVSVGLVNDLIVNPLLHAHFVLSPTTCHA